MINLNVSKDTWNELYAKIRAAGHAEAMKSDGMRLTGIEMGDVFLPCDHSAPAKPEAFPGCVNLALPWRLPDSAPRDGQYFLGLFRSTVIGTGRPAEYRHELRVVHRRHYAAPPIGNGYWADQHGNSIPDGSAFTFWAPLGYQPMEPYDRQRGPHGAFVDWSEFGGEKPPSAR